MDKFESLKAFTTVVEEGGFAAAARKLQLSRSAVNKFVINLENQLGAALLKRNLSAQEKGQDDLLSTLVLISPIVLS